MCGLLFVLISTLSISSESPTKLHVYTSDQSELHRIVWEIPLTALPVISKNEQTRFYVRGRIEGGGEPGNIDLAFYPGGAALERESLMLTFERRFAPGTHRLDLKLLTAEEKQLLEISKTFTTPSSSPALIDFLPSWPLEAHSVRIRYPKGGVLIHRTPFEAVVQGRDIAEVRFVLDGKVVKKITRPPYRAKIKLGSQPLMRDLAALALDKDGKVLAKDRVRVNQGPNAFRVRLLEPMAARQYEGAFRARMVVDTPAAATLGRVELFMNDKPVKRFQEGPFVTSLLTPEGEGPFHLRAHAKLMDGAEAEDSVVFNTPYAFEEMEVRRVNLWARVISRSGKPISGLGADDFTVLEDGQEMAVMDVEEFANLPLNLSFMIDISESMLPEIHRFSLGAQTLMESLYKPGDQNSIFVFQDVSRMIMPLSGKQEDIKRGIDVLKKEIAHVLPRGTGIYNAIVDGIHHLAGTPGRRALIVFTDGNDNSSSFDFPHVIRFAQQANVQVYVIGVPIIHGVSTGKGGLKVLCRETGGEFLRATFPQQMRTAFEDIEKHLRSQYRVGYQTSFEADDRDCRDVKVKMKKGMSAQTLGRICP